VNISVKRRTKTWLQVDPKKMEILGDNGIDAKQSSGSCSKRKRCSTSMVVFNTASLEEWHSAARREKRPCPRPADLTISPQNPDLSSVNSQGLGGVIC
jgi:hypothetical protein